MAGSLTIDNINGKVISSSPVATESQVIGVGQTWQNVMASRTRGVNYTNNTGKPIQVNISAQNISGQAMTLTVDGVISARAYLQGTSGEVNLSAIVPNNSVYRMDNSTSGTIFHWAELR